MLGAGVSLHTLLRRRALAAVCVALVVVVLSSLNVTSAAAGVVGCRADPIVKLSDGTILDVTADIGTDAGNIVSISYVVHGPPSSSLLYAISTPTIGFTGKETFKYFPDAAANTYITETVIHTKVNRVSITAHTTFANGIPSGSSNSLFQYTAVTGYNGDVLRSIVRR